MYRLYFTYDKQTLVKANLELLCENLADWILCSWTESQSMALICCSLLVFDEC